MSYTKGPWVIKGTLFGEWCISSEYSVGGVKLTNGRQHIASSPSASSKLNPDYFSMFYANAHLIAAAPDLLEALEDLVMDITERYDMEDPSTNPGMKCAVEAAQGAIAKARGGKE